MSVQGTTIINPGDNYHFPRNKCSFGYVLNTNGTESGQCVIYPMGSGKIQKTLTPQQTFSWKNEEIDYIYNSGNIPLEIIFSDEQFELSRSQAFQQTDIGQSNTYMKDDKIPNPLNLDQYGNIGIGLPTGAVNPTDRSWFLGTSDLPNRSWNLGSGDTPDRSWALGSTDNPAINQNDAVQTATSYNTGFALNNPSGYFGAVGQYVRITFSVPAGGYLHIKKIYGNAGAETLRYILSDDLAMLDNIWSSIVQGNVNISIPAGDTIQINSFGVQAVVQNTATSANTDINPFYYGLPLAFEFTYDRIINNINGTAAVTAYVQLLCKENAGGTAKVQEIMATYEGNPDITFSNTLTDGTTAGTTSGGGGGCWTANLPVWTGKNWVPFLTAFQEKIPILSATGYNIIEKVYNSGIHEIFEVAPDIWLTMPQIYRINGKEETSVYDQQAWQKLPHRFEETYDCKIEGVWFLTKNRIWIKDVKVKV